MVTDVDCVFLASTPPIQGVLGGLLKKIKKALIEHRNHICDFGMESLKRHLIVMMVNTMMIEMYRIAFHVISSIEVFQSLCSDASISMGVRVALYARYV